MYLGNLFMNSQSQFMFMQNLAPIASNSIYPQFGAANSYVTQTLNYANFVAAVGVDGCIQPPLSVADLYNSATNWAADGTCFAVTSINSTTASYPSGNSACYDTWTFSAQFAGPHTVVRACPNVYPVAYTVTLIASSQGAFPRAMVMLWTAQSTSIVSTYTFGCGSSGNLTSLQGAWSSSGGSCVSITSNETSISAPAWVWFNSSSSNAAMCTALVDFVAIPFEFRLVCGSTRYLGNLYLGVGSFTAATNVLADTIANSYPVAGQSSVMNLTFTFADFVGVGGCVTAPLTAMDIYGTSNTISNSTWAAGATCFAINPTSATMSSFISGVSTSTVITTIQTPSGPRQLSTTTSTTYYCHDTWSFSRNYNGPHMVSENCPGSSFSTFSVMILSTASIGGVTRPTSMAWTDTTTGVVSIFTRGCGGIAVNISSIPSGVFTNNLGQCVSLSTTASTITAPASMWFNSTDAGSAMCTATVNFLYTPLAYTLACPDQSYLGNIYLGSGQFSIAQNHLNSTLNPLYPGLLSSPSAVMQTFTDANFIGVGGCVPPPWNMLNLLSSAAGERGSVFADDSQCSNFTVVNASASAFNNSGVNCVDTWKFAYAYNGPHIVTRSCVGSGAVQFSVVVQANSTVTGSNAPSKLTFVAVNNPSLAFTYSRGCNVPFTNMSSFVGLFKASISGMCVDLRSSSSSITIPFNAILNNSEYSSQLALTGSPINCTMNMIFITEPYSYKLVCNGSAVYLGTISFGSSGMPSFTIFQNQLIQSLAPLYPVGTAASVLTETFTSANFVGAGGCIPTPLTTTSIYATSNTTLYSSWATDSACIVYTALNSTWSTYTDPSNGATCYDVWAFAGIVAGPHSVTKTCTNAAPVLFSVAVLLSSVSNGVSRPSVMSWTNSATGAVGTHSLGCSASTIPSVDVLTGLFRSNLVSGYAGCLTVNSNSSTSLLAPASAWFGNAAAGSSICVAVVNMITTPLSFKLTCNTDVYLGTLDLSTLNSTKSWSFALNNVSVSGGAKLLPGYSAPNQYFTQSWSAAAFTGVGGCLIAPYSAVNIYGSAPGSSWADETSCRTVVAFNSTVASFGQCTEEWNFAVPWNGPHSVTQSCAGSPVRHFSVTVLANATGPMPRMFMFVDTSTNAVSILTQGCGGVATNVTALGVFWRSNSNCVSFTATSLSTLTAPASVWYGTLPAGVSSSTACSAVFNFLSTPISYQLTCGSSVFWGSAFLTAGSTSAPFTLATHVQPIASAQYFASSLSVANAAGASVISVQSFNYAQFVNQDSNGGCITPPITVLDLFVNVSNSSTWAVDTASINNCLTFTSINHTYVSVSSGAQSCIQHWLFDSSTNGPHTVVQTCSGSGGLASGTFSASLLITSNGRVTVFAMTAANNAISTLTFGCGSSTGAAVLPLITSALWRTDAEQCFSLNITARVLTAPASAWLSSAILTASSISATSMCSAAVNILTVPATLRLTCGSSVFLGTLAPAPALAANGGPSIVVSLNSQAVTISGPSTMYPIASAAWTVTMSYASFIGATGCIPAPFTVSDLYSNSPFWASTEISSGCIAYSLQGYGVAQYTDLVDGATCTETWVYQSVFNGPHPVTQTCTTDNAVRTTLFNVTVLSNTTSRLPASLLYKPIVAVPNSSIAVLSVGCGNGANSVAQITGLWTNNTGACTTFSANTTTITASASQWFGSNAAAALLANGNASKLGTTAASLRSQAATVAATKCTAAVNLLSQPSVCKLTCNSTVYLGAIVLNAGQNSFSIVQNTRPIALSNLYPISSLIAANASYLYVQTYSAANYVGTGGCVPYPFRLVDLYPADGSSVWGTESGCSTFMGLNATTVNVTTSSGLVCKDTWVFNPSGSFAGPHSVTEVCSVSGGVQTSAVYSVRVYGSSVPTANQITWTTNGTTSTHTSSCRSVSNNVTLLSGLWMNNQGSCVTVTSTATTFSASAAQFFGTPSTSLASLAQCTATVNFNTAPLTYRLSCVGNSTVYLGALYIQDADWSSFTLHQNLMGIASMPTFSATVGSGMVQRNFSLSGCQTPAPTTAPPVTTPPTPAPTVAPVAQVAVTVKFTVPLAVAQTPQYQATVINNVATALNISSWRVKVGTVTAGSALIQIIILPDPNAVVVVTNSSNNSSSGSGGLNLAAALTPAALAQTLISMVSNPNSTLSVLLPVDSTYTPTTAVYNLCYDGSYQSVCPAAPTTTPSTDVSSFFSPLVIGIAGAVGAVALLGGGYLLYKRWSISKGKRRNFYLQNQDFEAPLPPTF
jgi:hypothetical protein